MTALGVGLLLGVVWVAFHVVPVVQAHRSPTWIAWWSLSTVPLRVLIVWLDSNTGKSVFAAALFHAPGNLGQIGPFLSFGAGGYPESAQRTTGLIMTIAAVVVTAPWGPRTLTRYRPS